MSTFALTLTSAENGGLIVISEVTDAKSRTRIGDVWVNENGETSIGGSGADYLREEALLWLAGAGAEVLAELRGKQPGSAGWLA